ncbi:methionine--tRNA ligase [Fimbriimonas ginsengisoli]|uniref:Methionine--tRNA ligase n=1 Tax=Fimbriimonas ginsengisoli Gsoil 348 TaxID=661478 RepID=A0A068NQ83_FIMGI|nr:methionine--tRNA ligase [Fimbriimonas ginsengisoli]AIE84920.1 methionyl-tRNA synthetase [Fimbriimonas ginsengisoli Gsoil 348]
MPKTTICTAIPYVNSVPHIGNILTDLSGDVTARYLRMRGEDVFLQVGTDENGLKIQEAAQAAGRDPHEFVAEIADRFRSVFDAVKISYDEFVRTSEPRHIRASQELFRRLREAGHVYLGKYEGWYDVSTETYFREEDLVDGKSPDGNPVRWVSEDNYFFRLSAFGDAILRHIEANPGFIRPENRKNEVVSFIKQGLRDVSITRRNPGWGIAVPDEPDKVIYVWFDAVINYVTATGWPDAGWEDRWPARVQWVGKDILTRFHATLWPAMLMGVGLPLFDTVAAHGWVLLGGEKISKSKGNVVRPIELATEFAAKAGISQDLAVDVLRHYLTATFPLESDSTFTYEDFDQRYNTDLANDLGNALNRSLAMAQKFVGGEVPDAAPEPEAIEAIETAKQAYAVAMDACEIGRAVEAAWGLVRFLNKYIDTRAPWALSKSNDPALGSVMKSMLLCLRACEGLVRPTIPSAADAIASQLNLEPTRTWDSIGRDESLPAGTILQTPRPIFPRLELTKKEDAKRVEPKNVESKPSTPPVAQPKAAPEIGIEDFVKVQLRIGRVFEAEPLEGSDKLMKLQVVIGDERRQIVAGIRKNYGAEDLIGRQVVVCTNLKPAKLRGVESQGMLLAATDSEGGAILLQPDREAPEGTNVK